MAIRPASMPEEPDDNWSHDSDGIDPADGLDQAPETAMLEIATAVTSASWRVQRFATILKFVGAAGFAVLPFVLQASEISRMLGLAVAVGLAVYGFRDILAPVRIAADSAGVTVVSGYAGHRRLRWSEIERVRLDSRTRYGARSELLEIDADSSLYFFSRYDLGVAPSNALDVITRIRDAGNATS